MATTHEDLAAALSTVEPVQLLGPALLGAHQPQPGEWFPNNIATDTLVEATIELIDYARDCRKSYHQLQRLLPTPLTTPIPEFPL